MKLLITGSNGLLGQKLVKQCMANQIDFLATSKGRNRNSHCPDDYYTDLDITNRHKIEELFQSFMPTHVIHTAAITNVDYCELNAKECDLVNVRSVKYLFTEAAKINAHFQLLSTDFVFDGSIGNYNETDVPNPLSIYANSKVQAEKILQNSKSLNWSIVRTIIVYGTGENLSRSNLVCWAKEALAKGNEMSVVDDQFRAPTWADDLAWACLRICELHQTGVFHISGPETMSIFEIVQRIANYYKFSLDHVKVVSSSILNQPAKRPTRTGFDLTKARNILGYSPKLLEETLELI
jgi:dTDP-4-dehydrorhamnose reductase